MSFLGSIFGGGSSDQAYNPVQNQNVSVDPAILAQQQQFAQQLQQQASGQGPSVADQQLKQALQQQQNSAAATAAGARGVNPGLALRQAQMQQGQNQAQAAQSGAIARAGEALGAEQQLGGTLSGMQQQNLGAQQANQQANLAAQAATRQAGQEQNKQQGSIISGIGSMLGSAAMMMNQGGQVKNYDDGGSVSSGSGPASIIGKMLSAGSQQQSPPSGQAPMSSASTFGQGMGHLLAKFGQSSDPTPGTTAGYGINTTAINPNAKEGDYASLAKGGKVPAMVSPGEIKIPPEKAKRAETAAQYAAYAARTGKKIPGKAKVSGDSLENDTVPMNLDEGSIVVPRSKSKKPEDAAAFVKALLASQRGKKS